MCWGVDTRLRNFLIIGNGDAKPNLVQCVGINSSRSSSSTIAFANVPIVSKGPCSNSHHKSGDLVMPQNTR